MSHAELPRNHHVWRVGTWSVLTRPLFWTGLALFAGLVLFCFVGPTIDHTSPLAVDMAQVHIPPGGGHWLGTDSLGRSELSRLMFGGQQIILVGLGASVLASALGVVLGLMSGMAGGFVDRFLVWGMDVAMAIPQLVPLLLVDSLIQPSVLSMILIVGLTMWPVVARLVRGQTLSLRERDYVVAAHSLGSGNVRILFRHILPALWAPVLTAASDQAAAAILVVATAGFLGLGLPPPWPNWGNMVSSGSSSLSFGYWWLMAFPGLAFVLLQFSISFMSQALRRSVQEKGAVT